MRKKLKPYRIMPLRIENDKYEVLRNLSYVNRISVSEIIRVGIEMVINQSKKQLTTGDI